MVLRDCTSLFFGGQTSNSSHLDHSSAMFVSNSAVWCVWWLWCLRMLRCPRGIGPARHCSPGLFLISFNSSKVQLFLSMWSFRLSKICDILIIDLVRVWLCYWWEEGMTDILGQASSLQKPMTITWCVLPVLSEYLVYYSECNVWFCGYHNGRRGWPGKSILLGLYCSSEGQYSLQSSN